MIVVGLMYLILGLFVAYSEARKIVRNRKIKIVSCFKLMYSFVYGFLPAIIFFRAECGISSIIDQSNSRSYLITGLVYFFFAIFVILIFDLGYKNKVSRVKHEIISCNTMYWSGIVLTIIGWFSLFLWTKAAGGIFAFIQHADGIRAGYYQLNNSFAFMQNVAKILLFASVVSFSNVLNQINMRKVISVIVFITSAIGSILFISAWDSRATLGLFILCLYFIYIDYSVSQKNISMRRRIIELAAILFAVFLLIIIAPTIFAFIRNDSNRVSTNMLPGLMTLIEHEFGFVLESQNLTLSFVNGNDFKPLFWNDFVNAIVSWIPTRFIPFEKPQTLWGMITSMANSRGTLPTDFISGSICEMWFFGIIVFPIIGGMIIRKLDIKFSENSMYCENQKLYQNGGEQAYDSYNSVMTYTIALIVINSVSHFQITAIVQGVFYIFLGFIVINFIQNQNR